jgi:serine protease Do
MATNQLVSRARRIVLPVGLAAAAAVFTSTCLFHGDTAHAAMMAGPLDESSVSALTNLDHAMEAVAARVTPAVVNVAVTSRGGDDAEQGADQQGQQPQNLPPGFAQFSGGGGQMQMQPQQQQLQHDIGSGVILTPDGYILTNNHVVNGATQIRVTLHDRRVLNARIVGVDKFTDLAVIKVNATDLPTVPWGNSAQLEPGQTVLAFGSPFGYLQFSVTRGIVSAINRPSPDASDARKLGGYIQTDAAINPGNSGGPLVDSRGEVIGINTLIATNTGSFEGAGFAIPEQIAKSVADQIIKTGSVRHGYLGISMNDVTPANAHFFNVSRADGAIVAQVTPDSPASRAGLANGDVIQQLNGQSMTDGSALQLAIADMTPGTRVQLGIVRNGHPQTVELTVGEYHANTQTAENDGAGNGSANQGGKLGIGMADLSPDIRQQLNIPENVKGAAIESVRPGSPAEDAGLQPGNVIVQVDRHPVASASEAVASVHAIPAGQDVLLLVWSPGGEGYRIVRPNQG